MKRTVNQFKGRIPKISDRALPETNATTATNCRLRSGDLEAYKGLTLVYNLSKTAPINTIYPMDRTGTSGGPFWLSWTNAETSPGTMMVDVVRGNLLSDNTERTYFTGAKDSTGSLYRPKFTNLSLAATTPVQSSAYPYDWRLLGVPAPGTFNNTVSPAQPLTVTQVLNPAIVPSIISDGSTLDGWNLSTQTAGNSTVTINSGSGNPAPSIDLFLKHGGTDPSAFLNQDIGILTGPGSFQFDVRVNSAGPGMAAQFILGGDSTGANGIQFNIPFGSSLFGNDITCFQSSGWGLPASVFIGTQSLSTNPALNAFYTIKFDYFNNVGLVNNFNIKITILSGLTVIDTVLFPSVTVPGNTFFGPFLYQGTLGASDVDLLLDNVKLSQVKLLDNPAYEATVWTYTYVDDFGQEGPPAPATDLYFIGPDIITTLTNFDGTGYTDYDIVSINLYRAVTGASSTQFQFEDNLPLSTTSYIDTKLDSQLAEVLQTDNYDLPPDDSLNIVNLPNGITIVSSGNTVCPSIQYRPYAYPVEYRLATDFPVIAMVGLETAAIALTQESAYLIIGSDPSTMSMSKITPEYGCVSKASAIRWGNYGAVYSSAQGLVIVGMSGAQLVTDGYVTKREWANFGPNTIRGGIYEDMYYGFYEKSNSSLAGFIFDQKDDGVGFIDLSEGSTANYPEHLKEILYITIGNQIFSWDTDASNPLTYVWQSKLWKNEYPITYSVGQIQGNYDPLFISAIDLSLYGSYLPSPSPVNYFNKSVGNSKEFLITPKVNYDFQFSLVGTTPVTTIQIAEDMMELS